MQAHLNTKRFYSIESTSSLAQEIDYILDLCIKYGDSELIRVLHEEDYLKYNAEENT